MERLQEQDSHLLEMPPLDFGHNLLQLLWDIGPCKSNGMGASPIDYGDIKAANSMLRLELNPWQCKLLRTLSKEYSNALHTLKGINEPAPYTAHVEATSEVRERVNNQFKALVASRKK